MIYLLRFANKIEDLGNRNKQKCASFDGKKFEILGWGSRGDSENEDMLKWGRQKRASGRKNRVKNRQKSSKTCQKARENSKNWNF